MWMCGWCQTGKHGLSLAQRRPWCYYAAHGHHLHLPRWTQLSQGHWPVPWLPNVETDLRLLQCTLFHRSQRWWWWRKVFVLLQKRVLAPGHPAAARAMFLIPAQITEELLDQVMLLKLMVWKQLTGHWREWVNGSLNDTKDWPNLTGTVDKIEIRYFHSS